MYNVRTIDRQSKILCPLGKEIVLSFSAYYARGLPEIGTIFPLESNESYIQSNVNVSNMG